MLKYLQLSVLPDLKVQKIKPVTEGHSSRKSMKCSLSMAMPL